MGIWMFSLKVKFIREIWTITVDILAVGTAKQAYSVSEIQRAHAI